MSKKWDFLDCLGSLASESQSPQPSYEQLAVSICMGVCMYVEKSKSNDLGLCIIHYLNHAYLGSGQHANNWQGMKVEESKRALN